MAHAAPRPRGAVSHAAPRESRVELEKLLLKALGNLPVANTDLWNHLWRPRIVLKWVKPHLSADGG